MGCNRGLCCGPVVAHMGSGSQQISRVQTPALAVTTHDSTLTLRFPAAAAAPPPPRRCCFPVGRPSPPPPSPSHPSLHWSSSRSSPSLATGGGADCIWALACSRRRASPSAATQLLRHSRKVCVSPSFSLHLSVSDRTPFPQFWESVPDLFDPPASGGSHAPVLVIAAAGGLGKGAGNNHVIRLLIISRGCGNACCNMVPGSNWIGRWSNNPSQVFL